MSGHSLAIACQKYDGMHSCMEISHNFHTLFKTFPLVKKLHTCEEGGSHLRIYLWHLLMNSKNKLLKKTVEVGQ